MNNNTLYNALTILNKEVDGIVRENTYYNNLIKDLEEQIYYYKEIYNNLLNDVNYNCNYNLKNKNIATINNKSNSFVYCILYNDINDLNDICVSNNSITSSIFGINKNKYKLDVNYPAFILDKKYKHDINTKNK